jgi:hypothetical protein
MPGGHRLLRGVEKSDVERGQVLVAMKTYLVVARVIF